MVELINLEKIKVALLTYSDVFAYSFICSVCSVFTMYWINKAAEKEERKKERKEMASFSIRFRVSDLDDKGTECLSFYVHTAMKTKQILKKLLTP